jgi:hypothetical protein
MGGMDWAGGGMVEGGWARGGMDEGGCERGEIGDGGWEMCEVRVVLVARGGGALL